MAIIRRAQSTADYTTVPNIVFRSGLSMEAAGCLCFLLSKPADWEVRSKHLAMVWGCSNDKITRIMKELKAAGFTRLEIKQDQNGRFLGRETVVYDCPQLVDNQSPQPVDKSSDDRNSENQNFGPKFGNSEITEFPSPKFPKFGNYGISGLLPNTDVSNKKTNTGAPMHARAREEDVPQPVEKPAWTPPEEINLEAWADFEQHRKEIREPLTDLARTKAVNILKRLNPEQQQACVDKSIVSRWSGLFPNRASKHETHQRETAVERNRRVNEELERRARRHFTEMD